MNLRIERVPLSGSPLCAAYLVGDARVRRFYAAGTPDRLDSYRGVAERIRADGSHSRWAHLAEAFPDLDGPARRRLGEVVKERGLFVSTGQQAGLFLGPLYTVYKALTAARLARQLEERLGLPVMPLFSIASEDHDWDEVNHTHVVDIDNQVVRIAVMRAEPGDPELDPSPPVESIRLGQDIDEALDNLTQLTPDTEFKAAILDPLRDAYRPGRGFAAAFQAALGHLLREHGFLLVRTANPYVKGTTRDLLWSEWERRRESEAGLLRREAELRDGGFEPQVAIAPGATNLFLTGRLGRDRILDQSGSARLRRSQERLSEAELRRVLEEEPGRVSPGVLLRPVTEARAFPVVATVGGPSEIAYLAQSQVLFELHGVPAPVVVPRSSFRLVEAKVAKVLDKYGVQADELAGDTTATISELIRARTPPELEAALAELRKVLGSALSRVEEAALDFDPGARSGMGSGKRAVFESIGVLESKLQSRVREKHQVMKSQLEKAAANLFPGGRPQERMLNFHPFLVRYGEGLIEAVYEQVVTPLDQGSSAGPDGLPR